MDAIVEWAKQHTVMMVVAAIAVLVVLIKIINAAGNRKKERALAEIKAENERRAAEKMQREKEQEKRKAQKQRQKENEWAVRAASIKMEAEKAGYPVPANLDAIHTGTLNIPAYINDKKCVYNYEDVPIPLRPEVPVNVLLGQELAFQPQGKDQMALCGSVVIGPVGQDKLARMIDDWRRNDDPVRAVITGVDESKKEAYFDLFFYRNQYQYCLRKNPDAKTYRLTGVKNEDIQSNLIGCHTGEECSLSYDYEKEKYAVENETGACIGYLPASAADLVNQAGEDEVSVYIARVDEDDELRSIPYVYLFE